MNSIFLLILIAITVFMMVNNFKRMKQYRKDKTYIELYTKVLKDTDGSYDELVAYIDKEEDPCLRAKSKLIKLYEDIRLNNDINELINEDYVKDIFCVGDAFSKEKSNLNSEVFIWYILLLSRCRTLSLIDVMDTLYEKVNIHKNDLESVVEYQCFASAYEVLLEKGTDGLVFLKKLLSGDYTEYSYDKNLIGIYKKVAACLLCYAGEIVDESDELLIKDFTTTLIGNRFTKDLDIYDKYGPKDDEVSQDNENKEEVVEETKEETVAESKEETNEEATEEVKEEASSDSEEKE